MWFSNEKILVLNIYCKEQGIGNLQQLIISCPVASVLYSEGKEEGRRKREEGREKREERRRLLSKKNLNFL
ncbi:hypothetical protein [Okeania sp. SIO2B3]|uniref:hypothetical protein n=1 Tax=Okeania sp. SIO2B3 TaxID=2607784 RepID=UPI0013BF6FFD|nr:hypothetical protein [Okeania sp. SIO2B3]NET45289.1 hypothetical protein [Okeania sp. SIO2B3]